ncbi:MAG TPA: hypothetical protein VEH31_17460 [Streptosporangiaceae bacterium]|nr:hypothetical protein [Streptosporangiaceae bacterium]
MDVDGAVSGIGLGERIERFLASQGVDVRQAVADAGRAEERRAQQARDRMRQAADLAGSLRRAKRKLRFEQNGWQQSAPGFSLARVTEAQSRVQQLEASLREACLGNEATIAEVKRRAAR